jgi:hypothetical protein
VEIIGEYCFSWCGFLREVTFEAESSLKEIGDFAFCWCNVERIEIPEKCEILSGLSLAGIENVSIHRGNEFLIVEDCFVKSVNGKEMIRYLGIEERVVVKGMIERVSAGCFRECKSLSEVTFTSDCQLERIDKQTFNMSGIKRIRIPLNVEIIGAQCFYECGSLSEVTFEGAVMEMGENVFEDCIALRCVRIPRGVKLSCKLPDRYAIEYCGPVLAREEIKASDLVMNMGDEYEESGDGGKCPG